jgi:hypothetical protein
VRELEDCGHEKVGSDCTVVSVGTVRRRPAYVPVFPPTRIVGIVNKAHVAVSATEVLIRFVNVPVAFSPLVVLVLARTEAETVECFRNELLVTGATDLRGAKQVTVIVCQMLPGIRPDQEVGQELLAALGSLPDILLWRCEDIIGISTLVHARYRMAHHTGSSLLHSRR